MFKKGFSKIAVTIFTAVLVLAVLGSVFYFGYRSDSDTPPRLSIGSDTLHGMLKKGTQGFLEFEEEDFDEFEDRKEKFDGEPIQLASGINYVYAEEELTVEDIVNCVDPEVESFLFANYDYKDKIFKVYPKGPFDPKETKEIDVDYKVKPGYGFVLIVEEPADIYCAIKSADEKGGSVLDDLMPDDKKGWVLFAAGDEDLGKVLEPFSWRIKFAFKMTGKEEFVKIEEEDFDEELDDYYLLWVKLGEEKVDVNENDEGDGAGDGDGDGRGDGEGSGDGDGRKKIEGAARAIPATPEEWRGTKNGEPAKESEIGSKEVLLRSGIVDGEPFANDQAIKAPKDLTVVKYDVIDTSGKDGYTVDISFTWVAPASAVGLTDYAIHRSKVNDHGDKQWVNTIIFPDKSIQKSVRYENFVPGTNYVFKVGAVYNNDSDNPFYSSEIRFILPTVIVNNSLPVETDNMVRPNSWEGFYEYVNDITFPSAEGILLDFVPFSRVDVKTFCSHMAVDYFSIADRYEANDFCQFDANGTSKNINNFIVFYPPDYDVVKNVKNIDIEVTKSPANDKETGFHIFTNTMSPDSSSDLESVKFSWKLKGYCEFAENDTEKICTVDINEDVGLVVLARAKFDDVSPDVLIKDIRLNL